MPARGSRSSKRIKRLNDDRAELRLQPLGREKVIVVYEDSNFQKARDSDTPFGWMTASRMFPSFDAIICTDKNIVTIQLAVSSKHSMKAEDFKRLKYNLPAEFEGNRNWCHVFVTDREEKAVLLRKQYQEVALERNILIDSAVLDVPSLKFAPEDVERAFTPRVCWYKLLYIDFRSYLGIIRTSLLRWTPVGWR